ncbi:MAG: sensor histidine kinase, partial [Halolamina sp.]
ELNTDRTIRGDPDRIQRLLENLFHNSVEHGSTGNPSGATEEGAAEELTVRVESCRGGFAVADNGSGIPPEERESVLKFGYSTAEEGTGLGLSIVTEIAEAHGWRVEVGESEMDGARFAFRGVAGGRETP